MNQLFNSMGQCSTPLNTLFFSEQNVNLVQRAIRQEYKNKTGVSIDYQDPRDLFAIMRSVFILNSSNGYVNACEQVKFMNQRVIKQAINQINTGLTQYMGYIRDVDSIAIPFATPINTSTYGKKIDFNEKIGL